MRCPPDIRRKAELGQRISKEEMKRWVRILHDKGWATPAWAPEWGGTGWDAVRQYIFKEELHMAPAPEPISFNVNMIGPTLIAFGSEEQKRHFLPRIASLDYWFCQGFSEPGAGSDLAALRTSAVRDGDHYVVDGQKLWTSTAHHADWCFLLVRTDPAAKKQQGITYLLMDMKTPGITIRPIVTIDGHHETNEMFLDKVRVPVAHRVGEENKGWDYAKYLLGHERSGIARVGVSKMRVRRAKQLAAQRAVQRPPADRGRALSRARGRDRGRAEGARDHADAADRRDGQAARRQARPEDLDPQDEGLAAAAGNGRAAARSGRLQRDGVRSGVRRPGCAPKPTGDDWALAIAPNHYWARHVSIVGGSNEIQRNILAKSVLGL